jgi:hypothetical protein
MTDFRFTNAAFVDEFDVVVTCEIIGEPGPDGQMLARGAVQLQSAAWTHSPSGSVRSTPNRGPSPTVQALPRSPSRCMEQVRYETRPVRGWATRKRSGCTCPGDSVTVSVPAVEGIALADFDLKPTHAVPVDPAGKIAPSGEVLDASGRTVATCG